MNGHFAHRWLPLVAYLFLACAIGYAIWQTDRLQDRDLEFQRDQQVQAAKATRQAIHIGCEQRNEVRVILREILAGFRERAEREGQSDLRVYNSAIARLADDDCDALSNSVPIPTPSRK